MVTGNTWTDRYLDATAFAALDEVWKYAWDDDLGTVPAAAVTDRAVALARERDPERLVVVLHAAAPPRSSLTRSTATTGWLDRKPQQRRESVGVAPARRGLDRARLAGLRGEPSARA